MTYDGIVSPMVLMSSSLSFPNFCKCAVLPKREIRTRKAVLDEKAVLVLVRAASSAASSAEEKRERSGREEREKEFRDIDQAEFVK